MTSPDQPGMYGDGPLGNIPPIHPGEILAEDFLKPAGLTQSQVAKDLGVSFRRVNEIVNGKRAITAETSLMLAKYFGMSDGFFLRLQGDYDLRCAKRDAGEQLARVHRLRTDTRSA